jgi:hypothetical protein
VAFGCSAAPLVHIVQHDINQNIRWVVKTGTLEREGSELVRKPVPPEELPEVDVANLKRLHIFEHIKRHRRIKRELLVALDKACSPVWRQPQAGDLGEGRV